MRKHKVEFTAFAKIDVREALAYYKKIDRKLATALRLEILEGARSLRILAEYEVKFNGLRTFNLKVYPYMFYYKIYEEQALVEIIAVIHKHALLPYGRS